MQQIYRIYLCRSAISIKLQSNFTEILLQHGCPVNLLHIFRILFPRNTSRGLLLGRVSLKRTSFSFRKMISSDTLATYNFFAITIHYYMCLACTHSYANSIFALYFIRVFCKNSPCGQVEEVNQLDSSQHGEWWNRGNTIEQILYGVYLV